MKILLWLFFWPFLLPFYIAKKMFKITLKAGNVDIKNVTNNIEKATSSLNTFDDKIQQKGLEDYRKRVGIESVDLNEDLYDY